MTCKYLQCKSFEVYLNFTSNIDLLKQRNVYMKKCTKCKFNVLRNNLQGDRNVPYM